MAVKTLDRRYEGLHIRLALDEKLLKPQLLFFGVSTAKAARAPLRHERVSGIGVGLNQSIHFVSIPTFYYFKCISLMATSSVISQTVIHQLKFRRNIHKSAHIIRIYSRTWQVLRSAR